MYKEKLPKEDENRQDLSIFSWMKLSLAIGTIYLFRVVGLSKAEDLLSTTSDSIPQSNGETRTGLVIEPGDTPQLARSSDEISR